MTCDTNPRLLTTSRQCYVHHFTVYEKGADVAFLDQYAESWSPEAEWRCEHCRALQCPECLGAGEVHTYDHGMEFDCGRSCMGRCPRCNGEAVIDD